MINTADSEQVFIGLLHGGNWLAKKYFKARAKQAEKLLPAIEKMLQATSYKLQAISVVSGPASFTALRIGVVTANTLAWSLQVPIVSFKLTEFENLDELARLVSAKVKSGRSEVIVKPFYGSQPNITKKI